MTENKRGKEDDRDNRKKQDLNTERRGLKRQRKSWNGKQSLITEKHGTNRVSKFYKRDLLIHNKSSCSTDAPPTYGQKKNLYNTHIAYTETDGRSDFNTSPKSYFPQLLW